MKILIPCDGDMNSYRYDPGIRKDMKDVNGYPEPMSEGDEELLLAEIGSLLRDGNRFRSMKGMFENMLKY